jgi:hypothetical protein
MIYEKDFRNLDIGSIIYRVKRNFGFPKYITFVDSDGVEWHRNENTTTIDLDTLKLIGKSIILVTGEFPQDYVEDDCFNFINMNDPEENYVLRLCDLDDLFLNYDDALNDVESMKKC